jgi:hypothetical protein
MKPVIALTEGCDIGHGIGFGGRCKLHAKGDRMADNRDVLEVLKFELKFLEQGGYGRLPREAWRPRFVFEDSPSCMNFNSKDREPCEQCLLMQFVPESARQEQVPCTHIPFSPHGETLDSLYRTGTQQEIEEALGAWLRATIRRIEAERAKQTTTADAPR